MLGVERRSAPQQLKTSEIVILTGVVFRGQMVCLTPVRIRFNFAEFATSEDVRKTSRQPATNLQLTDVTIQPPTHPVFNYHQKHQPHYQH